MKKLLFPILLLFSFAASAQFSIIKAPTYTHSLDSGYVPVTKDSAGYARLYHLPLSALGGAGGAATDTLPLHNQIVSLQESKIDASQAATQIGDSINANTKQFTNNFKWIIAGSDSLIDLTIDPATKTDLTKTKSDSSTIMSAVNSKASTSSPTITNAQLTGFPTISIIKSTRIARPDVNYTIDGTVYLIAYTSLTATRTLTFPAASSFPNQHFVIKDESGNASGTIKIMAAATIDGVVNPDLITTPYGVKRIYSNGTAWFSE